MNTPKRPLLRSAAFLALVSLAGCAVGPNYVRPSAPTPPAFKELAGWKSAAPADTLERGSWWTLFGDPDLDALEAKVVVSNQNLAAAEAAYRQARALVAENRASLFPTVSLGGDATVAGGGKGSTTTGSGTGTTSGGRSSDRYSVSLGATWAPDVWGRVRRAVEGARALAQASAADVANARLSAQTELASDYLQLRADDEEIRLYERTAQDYARSLKVAQNRYAAGVAAKSEVLTSQTQLQDAQASVEAIRQQRAVLEHAVAVLAGMAPAELTIAPKPFVLTIPDVPVMLPSALLERRPDIAAAERRVANANAQIGVNQAAFFPTLDLSASGGFASTALGALFKSSNLTWSLGASAAETLFDGGARRARVQQSRAAYDQAVAQYRQTVLSAFQQVEDQLAASQSLDRQSALRREESAAADQNEQVLADQYRAGTVSATDLVVAQNTALNARRTLIVAERDRLTAQVSLIEALGGGWSAAELPKRP